MDELTRPTTVGAAPTFRRIGRAAIVLLAMIGCSSSDRDSLFGGDGNSSIASNTDAGDSGVENANTSTAGTSNTGTGGAINLGDNDAGVGGSGGSGNTADSTSGGIPPIGIDSGPPSSADLVVCGDTVCNRALGQLCCIVGETTSCSTTGDGCDSMIACDHHEDCGDAMLCCGLQDSGRSGSTRPGNVSCRIDCSGDDHYEVGCSEPSSCGVDEVCCADTIRIQDKMSGISCDTSCGDFELCVTDADCGDSESCIPNTNGDDLPWSFRYCN